MDPETSAAGAGVIGSGSVGIDYAGVPATGGFSVGGIIKPLFYRTSQLSVLLKK